jgi:hypothetical protein
MRGSGQSPPGSQAHNNRAHSNDRGKTGVFGMRFVMRILGAVSGAYMHNKPEQRLFQIQLRQTAADAGKSTDCVLVHGRSLLPIFAPLPWKSLSFLFDSPFSPT